mmetsp:Transcript_57428/g.124808  ORF Transcript_57428/g.124808 Transcript_57428/m.124808 type:complete len:95 (-) Transcript_57428:427-711(-)
MLVDGLQGAAYFGAFSIFIFTGPFAGTSIHARKDSISALDMRRHRVAVCCFVACQVKQNRCHAARLALVAVEVHIVQVPPRMRRVSVVLTEGQL